MLLLSSICYIPKQPLSRTHTQRESILRKAEDLNTKLLNAGNLKQAQTEITGLEPLKLSTQWRKTLIRSAWNGGSTTVKCVDEKYIMWHITYLCTWAPSRWRTNEDGDRVWYLCTQKLDIFHHWKQLPLVQLGRISWILALSY
jgi:hypothetical protein